MLRRSTSFETNPMPMKIAMNRPNTPMAASPRSLMILTSCPAVSCPRRNDEAISITAKSTRLYGTRSRTDSRNTLSATQLAARTGPLAWMLRARTVAGFRHAANEEVFQRIAQRVQRDERRARRNQVGKQPLRWRIERELQRVSSGEISTVRRTDDAIRASTSGPRLDTTSSHPWTSKARISVRLPEAASRPLATTATRLQSASASARMCELKKTVRP